MAVQHYEPPMESEIPALQTNRRHGERFPLTLNLRFRLLSKNASWTNGSSLNFSHTGILFRTDCTTDLGASLELVVDWPASLGAVSKRELVLVGMVIRVRGSEIALSIRKFAFRGVQS